jgi:hypothetical protein
MQRDRVKQSRLEIGQKNGASGEESWKLLYAYLAVT